MKRADSGLTLMEVLIAMSLLSLLSLGVVMAMRVGLGSMERANKRLHANRRAIGAQRVLEQQIAGFMPVSADCVGAPGQAPVHASFFQGAPDSMRFVSSYSLQEAGRGRPRILELHVIPGEENRGVRLVVNERLYTGPLSAGTTCAGYAPDPESGLQVLRFLPIEVGPQSFVLADKLARCQFLYREVRPLPELERWVPQWVLREWPTAIRIEMAPLEGEAGPLAPMAMTAPVRVTKRSYESYADSYQ